jgi:hypothetical protein
MGRLDAQEVRSLWGRKNLFLCAAGEACAKVKSVRIRPQLQTTNLGHAARYTSALCKTVSLLVSKS